MTLKNKYFIYFLLVFFIIILSLPLIKMLNFAFIVSDDTNTVLCESLRKIFVSPCNGIYVASFFDRFFGTYLPRIMNIHPSYFKSHYFCYIETIFLMIFILILNNILVYKNKLNYFYLAGLFFTSSYLFIILQRQPYMLFVYDGFFRMLLPAFLWVSLFNILLKRLDDNNLKNIIIIGLLSFVCCISNEMICITTVIGFFILFIKSCLKSEYKKIYLPLIVLLFSIVGLFIMIKTGAFLRKSGNEVFNLQYFIQVYKQIIDFSSDYIKYIFGQHIIEYVLLILQILVLYFKYPGDKVAKSRVVVILSFLLGVYIFFYMLIGLGRTHYTPGQYWIVHNDLHVIYSIMLCAFNFSLLNLIIEYKIIRKYIICILLSVIAVMFSYKNLEFYNNFIKNEISYLRRETYKAEKIIRLANSQNRLALISKTLFNNEHFWGLFYSVHDRKENFIYYTSPYIDTLNQFEKDKKLTNGFIFTDEETAMNDFYRNGGYFTEDELKNINFNNLINKK